MAAVLPQPVLQVEEVVLLGPEHAGQGLAVETALVFVERLRRDVVVELVGVGNAARQSRGKARKRVVCCVTPQAKTYGLAPSSGHLQHVVRGGLGSDLRRVDGLTVPEMTYWWKASFT